MICAEATLPTPSVSKPGIGRVFRMLPVYKKVLWPDEGSLSNPARDSLTAAYRLVVLMAMSVAKSSSEAATGSETLVKWAPAATIQVRLSTRDLLEVTIVKKVKMATHRCRRQGSVHPIARAGKRTLVRQSLVWRDLG